jgi:hypothetical protein
VGVTEVFGFEGSGDGDVEAGVDFDSYGELVGDVDDVVVVDLQVLWGNP